MRKLFTYTLLLLLLGSGTLMAQVPQSINFQGVARDASGNPLPNTDLNLRLSAVRVSDNDVRYAEFQQTTTNALGIFAIKFGEGTQLSSGSFDNVIWKQGPFNLRVEMDAVGAGNFSLIGETELISVPFALFANSVGGTVDTSLTNEIQNISKTGNTISLDQGGGSVIDDVDDADNDPQNELQTLAISNDSLFLTGPGGNFITIPPDADNSITNELQTLSISGTSLSLSNGGGTVTVDNSVTNERQTLSLSGTSLSLSNGGGSVVVDPSTTNELQFLSFNGDTLSITNGNFVTVNDEDWIKSNDDIYYEDGNLAIGASPILSYRFYCNNDAITSGAFRNTYLFQYANTSSTGYGLYNRIYTTSAVNNYSYGVYSVVTKGSGGTGGFHYGFLGSVSNIVSSGSFTVTYGAYLSSYMNNTSLGSLNYGVYGRAYGSGTTNYAAYFSGNLYSTGTFTASDRKLKKNIVPLTSSLSLLNQINIYEYEYDLDKYPYMSLPEGTQVGLLADELETAAPELVKQTTARAPIIEERTAKHYLGEGNYVVDSDEHVTLGEDVDFKAVNYEALIPVLVQSIQDQQETLKVLKERLSELEAEAARREAGN